MGERTSNLTSQLHVFCDCGIVVELAKYLLFVRLQQATLCICEVVPRHCIKCFLALSRSLNNICSLCAYNRPHCASVKCFPALYKVFYLFFHCVFFTRPTIVLCGLPLAFRGEALTVGRALCDFARIEQKQKQKK